MKKVTLYNGNNKNMMIMMEMKTMTGKKEQGNTRKLNQCYIFEKHVSEM